ncbi:Uncharacterized protein Adt_37174 [Abeliophyllum distichum]|uniref:Uncharacterized protein n=1 Tax=Abeliophyllum distichum TaxID=126358 RepID=A0ABD1QLQ1_9LAMI
MAAATIQRKDLEKLMQMLNILTEMLIDQRIILSSIIIREPPLLELMINPSARRTRSLMENIASFESGISELLLGFTRDEDGIKGVGRKKPKMLNLFCINRQTFLDGND